MLDSDFNAKLGDFGLARLAEHGRSLAYTPLAGTVAYVAPEYATTGRASKESDVYSFGIVAIENACGRKVTDRKVIRQDHMNLTEWFWDLYGEGKILDAADPRLNGGFNEQQAECLLILGLWCAHPDAKLRPTRIEAIHVLGCIAPLPHLLSKMPMFSYFGSFSTSSSGTSFARIKKQPPGTGYRDLAKRGFAVVYKGLLRELTFGLWRRKGKKEDNDLEMGYNNLVLMKQETLADRRSDTLNEGFLRELEFGWSKRSKGKKETDDLEMGGWTRMFSYQELVCATSNFSDHLKVGNGVLYRGFLEELKSYFAVERLTIDYYHHLSEVKVI